MMARLCIRQLPNDTENPLRSQPGDVVSMVDDDHVFTTAERALYRIIDLPGVPQEKLAYLLEPQNLMGAAGEEMIALRKVRLDLAVFPAAQKVATEANIAAVVRER